MKTFNDFIESLNIESLQKRALDSVMQVPSNDLSQDEKTWEINFVLAYSAQFSLLILEAYHKALIEK